MKKRLPALDSGLITTQLKTDGRQYITVTSAVKQFVASLSNFLYTGMWFDWRGGCSPSKRIFKSKTFREKVDKNASHRQHSRLTKLDGLKRLLHSEIGRKACLAKQCRA
jgi:hypothetical protein